MAKLMSHGTEIVRAVQTHASERSYARTTTVLMSDGAVLEKVQVRLQDERAYDAGHFRILMRVPPGTRASTWAELYRGRRECVVDVVAPHLMQTPLRVGR